VHACVRVCVCVCVCVCMFVCVCVCMVMSVCVFFFIYFNSVWMNMIVMISSLTIGGLNCLKLR
jgi:hypothetical protein